MIFPLASKHFGPAEGDFRVTLKLGRQARARLRHHHNRLTVQLTISSEGYPLKRVTAVLT